MSHKHNDKDLTLVQHLSPGMKVKIQGTETPPEVHLRVYRCWSFIFFTHMPGEGYHRWLRSLLLCLCDVFQGLSNSLVCWFILLWLGMHHKHACVYANKETTLTHVLLLIMSVHFPPTPHPDYASVLFVLFFCLFFGGCFFPGVLLLLLFLLLFYCCSFPSTSIWGFYSKQQCIYPLRNAFHSHSYFFA